MKRVCIMKKEKARLMTLDAADETEFRATEATEGNAPNATRLRVYAVTNALRRSSRLSVKLRERSRTSIVAFATHFVNRVAILRARRPRSILQSPARPRRSRRHLSSASDLHLYKSLPSPLPLPLSLSLPISAESAASRLLRAATDRAVSAVASAGEKRGADRRGNAVPFRDPDPDDPVSRIRSRRSRHPARRRFLARSSRASSRIVHHCAVSSFLLHSFPHRRRNVCAKEFRRAISCEIPVASVRRQFFNEL